MSSLHKTLNKLNHQLAHNIITKSYYNKTTTIRMQYAGIWKGSVKAPNGTDFRQHDWFNDSDTIDVTTNNLVILSLYSWFAKRNSAMFLSTLTFYKI